MWAGSLALKKHPGVCSLADGITSSVSDLPDRFHRSHFHSAPKPGGAGVYQLNEQNADPSCLIENSKIAMSDKRHTKQGSL
jgi:hypothetical protein